MDASEPPVVGGTGSAFALSAGAADLVHPAAGDAHKQTALAKQLLVTVG